MTVGGGAAAPLDPNQLRDVMLRGCGTRRDKMSLCCTHSKRVPLVPHPGGIQLALLGDSGVQCAVCSIVRESDSCKFVGVVGVQV